MEKLLKYLEDKKFINWVHSPNKQNSTYWNNYLEQNPSEKENIERSRRLLLIVRAKEEANIDREIRKVYSEIESKLYQKKRPLLHVLSSSFLKYAASVLFIFTIGGMAYYFISKDDPYAEIARIEVDMKNSDDAKLMLADGNLVSIEEKESTIEHKMDGNIIINDKDTVSSELIAQDTKMNQLIVPYGKNSSIQLPDGSIVFLNAGSRLVYPSLFKGRKREVYLVGEGLFDVAHNELQPFIVKTAKLSIEVLGTVFNVSAYDSDDIIETVLVEGKVRLKEHGINFFKDGETLAPNQLALYDVGSSETVISKVNVENYISWYKGYLNFQSSDLNRIVKKLERYYNIELELGDPSIGGRFISGKLKLKEEKELVLNVLANASSTKLEKINETTYMLK